MTFSLRTQPNTWPKWVKTQTMPRGFQKREDWEGEAKKNNQAIDIYSKYTITLKGRFKEYIGNNLTSKYNPNLTFYIPSFNVKKHLIINSLKISVKNCLPANSSKLPFWVFIETALKTWAYLFITDSAFPIFPFLKPPRYEMTKTVPNCGQCSTETSHCLFNAYCLQCSARRVLDTFSKPQRAKAIQTWAKRLNVHESELQQAVIALHKIRKAAQAPTYKHPEL